MWAKAFFASARHRALLSMPATFLPLRRRARLSAPDTSACNQGCRRHGFSSVSKRDIVSRRPPGAASGFSSPLAPLSRARVPRRDFRLRTEPLRSVDGQHIRLVGRLLACPPRRAIPWARADSDRLGIGDRIDPPFSNASPSSPADKRATRFLQSRDAVRTQPGWRDERGVPIPGTAIFSRAGRDFVLTPSSKLYAQTAV